MTRLPEHAILIMTDGQWDAAVFPGDHPNLDAEVVAEAERRKQAVAPEKVHVYRVPLAGAAEIDAVPAHQVPAALADRP